MADKSLTAPLAIVKVSGIAVGKLKSIRCTESVRLGRIIGLGRINPSELPPLDWNGTLNAGSFLIDLRQAIFPGSSQRICQTVEEWQDTLCLNTDGVQVDILRKVFGSRNAAGIIIPAFEIVASIKGCFANRESFDITESQISGRDMDFEYMTPFLFPI
jgi:hypothetical protein